MRILDATQIENIESECSPLAYFSSFWHLFYAKLLFFIWTNCEND